jgi:hypothetical protein
MKMSHLMTAAAFATLVGGAAYAQSTDQSMAQPGATPPSATTDAAPPATQMTPGQPDAMSTTTPSTGATDSSMSTTGANQYNYNANTQPTSSSTLGDPTTMKAGDPNVVSNGPVPDTQENRAKYGKPMSNAGKRSKPAGN